jgi:outer membrane protein assembly factor BamB
MSVAVSPTGATAGQVYVGGYYGDIAVIDPSGNIVGNIGGSFGRQPYALAVGPTGANAGNIYVGNFGYSTVTVLSPDGTILDTIAVNGPAGIAIAP